MKTVVLDTNVLMLNPDALYSYPGSQIALPEVILAELDKLKISHADSETRFKGREVSRRLFELSDGQSLIAGVDIPGGGTLRIVPFDTAIPSPEGFSSKNPDDRIVVTAQRLTQEASGDDEVILITNDLNMLLKAQTLGIRTQRDDLDEDRSFTQRYIVRPFQRYRTPVILLCIAIAIFAASIVVMVRASNLSEQASLPSEYRNFLSSEQADGIDALIRLQTDPNDEASLLTVANLYNEYYKEAVSSGSTTAEDYAKKGIQYYTRYLQVNPTDTKAMSNLALLEFYTGDTEGSLSGLENALTQNADDINLNYTMGIVQMQGNHDYASATQYFNRTVELCGDDQAYADIKTNAQDYLEQVASEQEKLAEPAADGVAI